MPCDAECPPEPTASDDESREVGERSEPKALGSDETASKQDEGAEGTSGDQDSSRQATKSPDLGERLLALQRPRDAGDNLITRPPADEVITFWSVSVAELYIGPEIDSLTKALSGINWSSSDRNVPDEIEKARMGYQYVSSRFWLISDTVESGFLDDHARTSIPVGVDRVYGEYVVAGPSIVALVLTFALDDTEAKKLDVALRDDAESRLDRLGERKFSIPTVENVKKERVCAVRDDAARRCRSWLNDRMPGTLAATKEGLGPPMCGLLSLAKGEPFKTDAPYMHVLDLKSDFFASRFMNQEYLFLTTPLNTSADNAMVGAFNEAQALENRGLEHVEAAPEIFHEAIFSLMIAESLYAALLAFGPRLRDLRSNMSKLDLDTTSDPQVLGLRNQLLGVCRDLSILYSDLVIVLDDAGIIWREFRPLRSVRRTGSSSVLTTADTKKRQLRTTMEGLQAQETGIRDLILVTSQAIGETRDLDLHTKVLGLTNKLNRLTTWLIVLTVALVILGLAGFVVQVTNSPTVDVKLPQTSRTSSSPSPVVRPSASGTTSTNSAPSAQPSTSRG